MSKSLLMDDDEGGEASATADGWRTSVRWYRRCRRTMKQVPRTPSSTDSPMSLLSTSALPLSLCRLCEPKYSVFTPFVLKNEGLVSVYATSVVSGRHTQPNYNTNRRVPWRRKYFWKRLRKHFLENVFESASSKTFPVIRNIVSYRFRNTFPRKRVLKTFHCKHFRKYISSKTFSPPENRWRNFYSQPTMILTILITTT